MSERYFISLRYPNYHYCTVAVVGNEEFVDPCTDEYDKHLGRNTNGKICYKTELGMYMFY